MSEQNNLSFLNQLATPIYNGISNIGGAVSDGFSSFSNYMTGDYDANGNGSIDTNEKGISQFDLSPLGKLHTKLSSVIGSGDNARSGYQIGGELLAGLFGAYSQRQNFKDQLAQARQNFGLSKATTQLNALNQATNFGNQLVQNAQARSEWNPETANSYANNSAIALNQMNNALQGIGVSPNALQGQINALQKYSQLNNTRLA